MEVYPGRAGAETSDLLEWASENVNAIGKRFNALDAPPIRGTVKGGWLTDRNGKRFTFARSGGIEVFVHENSFVYPEDIDTVGPGTQVLFFMAKGPQGLRAESIIVEDGYKDRPEEVLAGLRAQDLIAYMKKGPRFPFIKIWSDGRSVQDEEAPAEFSESLRRTISTLLPIMSSEPSASSSIERLRSSARIAEGALYLLCCMHRDMPEEAVEFLAEAIEEEGYEAFRPWRFCSHTAFAIGDGKMDWQWSLLSRCLDLVRGFRVSFDNARDCIRLLRIALWRCPQLLERIGRPDLALVITQLNRLLERDVAGLRDDDDELDRRDLMDRLELSLALLRTRASEDASISKLLGPEAEMTKEISGKVQAIVDLVTEREIPIASRVTLKLDKPAALHNTPDLLYALLLYLTGDDAAQAIEVESVDTGAE